MLPDVRAGKANAATKQPADDSRNSDVVVRRLDRAATLPQGPNSQRA